MRNGMLYLCLERLLNDAYADFLMYRRKPMFIFLTSLQIIREFKATLSNRLQHTSCPYH